MNSNRRSFIRTGSLLAVGGILKPSWLFASERERIQLTSADRSIFEFVARYSSNYRIVGSSVLAKLRGNLPATTKILVEIRDPKKLVSVFSSGPFVNARAEGNRVTFLHKGVGFAIENLLRADFATRLAGSGLPKNSTFAHDGLVYDPTTRRLTDPLEAAGSSEIKVVNPGLVGPEAFDAVLRALLEVRETGLVEGVGFRQWRDNVLSTAECDENAIVATLVNRFCELSSCAQEMSDIVMQSVLVKSALQKAGVRASQLQPNYLNV